MKYYSFLPMAHAFGINVMCYVFLKSLHICFGTGDVRKIMEELRAFKPHFTAFVPKILSRIVSSIELSLKNMKGFKGKMAKIAVSRKLMNKQLYNKNTHTIFDMIVFKKMR